MRKQSHQPIAAPEMGNSETSAKIQNILQRPASKNNGEKSGSTLDD
jgi:hypothetical protein